MKICDKCKNQITNTIRLELAIRGEVRLQLYSLGLDSTFFDFCSIPCAIEFLKEAETLIKLKPSQSQGG